MKSGILFFGILMLFAQTATGTNESFLSIAVSHTGATYSFELNFSWDEMGAGDPIPGLPEEE
ncbi:MAG: hypothetical protein KDC44_04710, partial [Phaeodactylibacter sp.]|nr:hypothetical protein [Phaeodactylibacter sp.]